MWTTGVLDNAIECSVEDDILKVDPVNERIYAKYSHMVRTFSECASKWDDISYEDASRMDRVVLGCFAGARNPGGMRYIDSIVYKTIYMYISTK